MNKEVVNRWLLTITSRSAIAKNTKIRLGGEKVRGEEKT